MMNNLLAHFSDYTPPVAVVSILLCLFLVMFSPLKPEYIGLLGIIFYVFLMVFFWF